MREIDFGQLTRIRNPERPDYEAGIVCPKRRSNVPFNGLGPKVIAALVAIGVVALLHTPVMAATQDVAMASCSTSDHGASLVYNPVPEIPDGVAARGATVLRIDLSASGTIQTLAVAQSSGDPSLDFEAMHVARESRYAPASANCAAAADSFLYDVVFAD